jgi:LacI family gluconate utilization system Gnt-I transcriptional repressor
MVSDPLRAKILKAVDELGYFRNRVASGLASGTARLVPVVVPTLLHSVYIPFLEGGYSVLAEHGYQIILSTTEYQVSSEDQLVEALLGWSPDGLFLSGVDHFARTLSLLKRTQIPVVEVMDLSDPPIGINVGFSHYRVGVVVAEYFYRKGYRRIALAGTLTEIDLRSVKRIAGFQQTLKDYGLPPEPLNLQGWQLVDELNRVFAGEKPSGFSSAVHIVTHENVEFDGGKNSLFDPDNGYRDQYKKIWGK